MRAPLLLLVLVALPLGARAQDVVVRSGGRGRATEAVRSIADRRHVLRAGKDRLDIARDTTIDTNLLVLGRPTYLSGRVLGDVVVVGADLYLRPGSDVTGRAVAIGGTVSSTMLGRVGDGVESIRDETFDAHLEGDHYVLEHRSLRAEDGEDPLFAPAGFFGVKAPGYDRVDGLSLPVGAIVQFRDHALEIEPVATYRSRLGVVDPGLFVRTRDRETFRFAGRVARDTRTNEGWIYSDLINAVTSIFGGTDTRNYFRADLGEGRLFHWTERGSSSMEPYLGGRFERVRPITGAGNVWSLFGRDDSLRMARPNPLVERGDIGSVLAGIRLNNASFVRSVIRVDAEQLLSAPAGTSNVTQFVIDGEVEVPSFRTHMLKVHAHGVGTVGGGAPRARYVYLGGPGTLSTLDLLEQGGTALLYVESRYLIPLPSIRLPVLGSPVLTLRDAFGGAGVGSLPELQHEIGVGIGLQILRVEYTQAVAGKSGSHFGFGISLSRQ